MHRATWGCLVAALLLHTPAGAEPQWSLEASLGAAYSFRTPLSITQTGQPDLRVSARWETRAFEPPLYYALRLGRWEHDRGWAVELVHHKIHLRDAPSEVQAFEVSHGYNLLTLLRARMMGTAFVGAGGGLVVAHPESRVRDLALEGGGVSGSGYHVTGPALSVFAGVRHPIGRSRAFVVVEGKLTAAHAVLPVARGWSRVPNIAAHVLLGLGITRGNATLATAPGSP